MRSESKFVFSRKEVIEIIKAAVEETVGDRLCEVIFDEDEIVIDGDFESVSIKMVTDDSKYQDDEEDDVDEDEVDEDEVDVDEDEVDEDEEEDKPATKGLRRRSKDAFDEDEDEVDDEDAEVTRKPIHLTVVVDEGHYHFATCDDGSLWILGPVARKWEPLPSIPQGAVPKVRR